MKRNLEGLSSHVPSIATIGYLLNIYDITSNKQIFFRKHKINNKKK